MKSNMSFFDILKEYQSLEKTDLGTFSFPVSPPFLCLILLPLFFPSRISSLTPTFFLKTVE